MLFFLALSLAAQDATPTPVPVPAVPTIFIAGDSTSQNGNPVATGWGKLFPEYFDAAKVRIVNRSLGGRSSRTFITEGHWDRMLAQLRKGDFVIIQFGHNDAGALNQEPPGSTRPLRARGTIPGIGTESEEIDNVLTGQRETVYSFGWYLRKMIADVRAKDATPILLTLTKTNTWKDGRIPCAFDGYRQWTWQTARNERVAFLDLTRIIADRYQREGPDAVKGQFIDDTVHTNITGATANARDVVSGLRRLADLPLRKWLSKDGRNVPADRGPPAASVCSPLLLTPP
jgi:lysophospholipase L1-like esterase